MLQFRYTDLATTVLLTEVFLFLNEIRRVLRPKHMIRRTELRTYATF